MNGESDDKTQGQDLQGQQPQGNPQDGNAQDAGMQVQVTPPAAPATTGAASNDEFEKLLSEQDVRIKELEDQLAEAAKTAENAEKLSSEITDLKSQFATERSDFALKLAGCRNNKAAHALLDDHDGDVEALKKAEPWLFEDASSQSGTTGFEPAGAASTDEDTTLKRWRAIAGLEDEQA